MGRIIGATSNHKSNSVYLVAPFQFFEALLVEPPFCCSKRTLRIRGSQIPTRGSPKKKEANLGFKDSLCEYQLDNDEMKEEEAYSRLHAVCMAGESEEGGPAPVLQLQSTNRLGCALATCKCKKLRRNFCDVMKAELCECVCILSYSMLLHDDVVNTRSTEN